jgi:hypothetical protein
LFGLNRKKLFFISYVLFIFAYVALLLQDLGLCGGESVVIWSPSMFENSCGAKNSVVADPVDF